MPAFARLLAAAPWLLAVYWTALFVGTHTPVRELPDVNLNDKLLHFGAYFGLAVLLTLTLRRLDWEARLALPVAAAYGALDELLQIPVGRQCDLIDWIADVAGAWAGVAFTVWVLRKVEPERSERVM